LALRCASAIWPPRCETSSIKRADGALVGKVGGAFTSTASQHGGHETTLVSFHFTLLHHGMIVVGLPYTEQRLLNMAEFTGGTNSGATTLAGIDGSRQPSENELAIARFQGRHVAQITNALIAGRKVVG
jgi:NAD(P)H:quinone oxidoreductase type IV